MTLSLGRRTLVLLVLGCIDLVYGSALLVADAAGTTNRWWTTARWWPAAQGELFQIDIYWWGLVWVIIGGLLLTAPFHDSDRFLYALAMMIKSAWGFGALHWALTTSSPGLWGIAGMYIGLSLVVLLVAGWPDVPTVPVIPAPSVTREEDP